MAKQLHLTYNDTEYTLEYTRRTVQELERQGFVADDIDRKPMTILPQLWSGAFLAHHRWVKEPLRQEIYSKIPHKEELIEKLVELYNEPILALVGEPDEGDEGNVTWTANF